MTQLQFTEFTSRIPSRLRSSWDQVRNNTYEMLMDSSGKISRANLNTTIDNLIQNHRKNSKKLEHMSVDSIVEYREEDKLTSRIRKPNKCPSNTSSEVKSV